MLKQSSAMMIHRALGHAAGRRGAAGGVRGARAGGGRGDGPCAAARSVAGASRSCGPLGGAARRIGLGSHVSGNAGEHARQRRIPHLYLGYYVAGCPSMEYKRLFVPNQVLRSDGHWHDFTME